MVRDCKACVLKQAVRINNPAAYEEWKRNVCKFSYHGTAGNMEPVGAKRIWDRSIKKNGAYVMLSFMVMGTVNVLRVSVVHLPRH